MHIAILDATSLLAKDLIRSFETHSLFERCIALTMNLRVQALVMLVDRDELLRTGMPLDRIDKVFVDAASATPDTRAWTGQLLEHALPDALHTLQTSPRSPNAS